LFMLEQENIDTELCIVSVVILYCK